MFLWPRTKVRHSRRTEIDKKQKPEPELRRKNEDCHPSSSLTLLFRIGRNQRKRTKSVPVPPSSDETQKPIVCSTQRHPQLLSHIEPFQVNMSFTAVDQAVNVALVVPRAIDDDLCMPFPQRLMEIISNDENAGIISWLPHGKGFDITKKKQFAAEILPRYFKHSSKWTSFTRKLNRWGFTRITSGPEQGSYYHKYFLRDQPRLCHQMHCESGPKFHSFHQQEAPVMQMPAPSNVAPGFMEAAQIAMLKQQLQTRAENNHQVTQKLSQNLYTQLLHGKLGVINPQADIKQEFVQQRQANHKTSGNGGVRRANAA